MSRSREAAFLEHLDELGATPLYAKYAGGHEPHHVRCAAGHDCHPRPNGVFRGVGICLTCSGKDPAVAEANFRARVAAKGGTPLYDEYRGVHVPLLVRCPVGHEVLIRPMSVMSGRFCQICAGNYLGSGEASFRARLAGFGATPLYEKYLGARSPHHVQCAAGHDCWPRPGNLALGSGPCRRCKGKAWDSFYVVTAPLNVKFGITSTQSADRLPRHARHGYATVVRLVTNLPGTVAPDTERAVIAALIQAGEQPVRGKEYFDISCLGLILDVADSWLGVNS